MDRSWVLIIGIAAAGSPALLGCTPVAPWPSDACCDPQAEPGVGDNPICIEGATCCADGTWRCNEGDGSSTCDANCPAGSCTLTRDAACAAAEFCLLDTAECLQDGAVGQCVALPDACTLEFAPVCGCDGTTYGNECGAWAAGVNVASAGACD